MATTPKREDYVVLVPFPRRGHWTAKGQRLSLLACEAEQLLRIKRIAPAAAVAKATTKAAKGE